MGDNIFDCAQRGDQQFEMRRKASFSKLTGNIPRSFAGGESGEELPTGVAANQEKLWQLMDRYLTTDVATIQRGIVNHVEYTLARNRFNLDLESCYRATAYSIRDRLIEAFNDTNQFFFAKDFKRCYYLSLEFLVGRAMQNALTNLDIAENYRKALADLGYDLEALYEYEHDAALGNGGLGRLAACFLDSMATLNYPCWGYGIRYTYGIFEQKIVNGWQVEYPDYWLVQDNPWEICRHDCTYAVRFGGEVREYVDEKGQNRYKWIGGDIVQAVAHDNPVPGFDTYNCINMRLWKAAPRREFDFEFFNAGRYLDAVAERQNAECISAVLYPNDNTEKGKELRLRQQYFFVCATLQDVLRRFKKKPNRDWSELPKKLVIQLNDTHPTIAIPELMRILVDIEKLEWDYAWGLTKQVFNYTNHTVLPEALEKWPAGLVERLLPRHLLIINEINFQFLTEVRTKFGDNWQKIGRMSIYEEGWCKLIRMANLAVIGSRKVNGVAAIHSELVKRDLFPEYKEYYALCGDPNKFVNVTNGVTPRRWMHCSNRPLSDLISSWLGSDSWLRQLDLCAGLCNHMSDEDMLKEWSEVKRKNKVRLAKWVSHNGGPKLNPDTMLFDIQVKRIHEYKRQLMNCLYMIHRYLKIKKMSPEERKNVQPRASMIGGKAAPGYAIAKSIIKMVNSIACCVNGDPDVSPYFKVYFLPNYNVSAAQVIIPACDVTQQISTAGTEASGTSNMKFVMNGGLIIGTLDGANVEIREECGPETMFLFGVTEGQVNGIRAKAAQGNYPIDARLQEVFNWVRQGNLSAGDHRAHTEFCNVIDRLTENGNGHNGDFYLVCHDFPDYCRAQEEVDEIYKNNRKKWWQLTIKATASMGKFTTDRTISEYAKLIWDIEVAERPPPSPELMRKLASMTNLGATPMAPIQAAVAASPAPRGVAVSAAKPAEVDMEEGGPHALPPPALASSAKGAVSTGTASAAKGNSPTVAAASAVSAVPAVAVAAKQADMGEPVAESDAKMKTRKSSGADKTTSTTGPATPTANASHAT